MSAATPESTAYTESETHSVRPLSGYPGPVAHLMSPETRDVLAVQGVVLKALRSALEDSFVQEVLPTVIGPVTDPGIRGSKQAEFDYYGRPYKIMSSVILYKQAVLLAAPRAYFVAPNVRLEPPSAADTARHLVEFTQCDVELAHSSQHDAMLLAERLVRAAVTAVLDDCAPQLERLGRTLDRLEATLTDFASLSHAEAMRLVGSGRGDLELSWDEERALSREITRPTFIIGYPRGSRGFYDRADPADPDTLLDFDLILPEGFGEVASGGERESKPSTAVARMRETGEDPRKYGWYLDALDAGVPPSAGFGLGIERLTRFIAGLPFVWQARAFPKMPGEFLP